MAALHAATLIIPNERLRNIVDRGINTDELAEPNAFAIPGTIAAYTQGADWVHELNTTITANKQTLTKFVAKNIPQIHVITGHATYLVWLDCAEISHDSVKLCQAIRDTTGLFLSDGAEYGGDGGHYLRINVACPPERLQDGLNRLATGINNYQE